MSIHVLPGGKIPVIADVDVAVIGGSFAGLAAALRLAQRGKNVMVVEPRTYLGSELTANIRLWLQGDVGFSSELMEQVIEDCGKKITHAGKEYIVFPPDRLKIFLEDLLLSSGIKILYSSLPVGITPLEDGIYGLVIGNKSGRQVVKCKLIVDSSETSVTSFLIGEGPVIPKFGSKAVYKRVLEFDRVKDFTQSTISVPDRLGVNGNKVTVFPSFNGGGHLFIEYEMVLNSENSLVASQKREVYAQKKGIEIAEYLIRNIPEFESALLSSSSFELKGPYPVEKVKGLGLEPDFTSMKIDSFPVWCFYKDFYENANTGWLDAALAASYGEQIADEISLASLSGNHTPLDPETTLENYEVSIPSFLEGSFEKVDIPQQSIQVNKYAQILVAGGGTSGAPAAIVAGREGIKTIVVELNPGLGGTGTFGGVDSYWFGNQIGYAKKIDNLVRKVHKKINYKSNKWNIEAKKYVFLSLAEQYGVEMLFNAILFGAIKKGNRVVGGIVATRWGVCTILADCTLDATGDGDLAAFAGAEFHYGSKRHHLVMWYSLAQYVRPGRIQNNFTSMVNVSDIRDYTRAILAGRRRWRKEDRSAYDHGIYVAPRESRHIIGDVVMTLADQLLQRKWEDCINIHFSNHDMKGINEEPWLHVGLIPPNLKIEIPYRMLHPKGIEGILVVGKAVSATHDGLPAIRMQADLENLGGIAALAASLAVKNGKTPREIHYKDVQKLLVDKGILPESILKRHLKPISYTDEDLERLVDTIETDKPLYEYSNMRMQEVHEGSIPFAEICTVGKRIIPFIEKAYHKATGTKKVRLAQALAFYGSSTGVPTLIEELEKQFSGDELPKQTASILYVTTPPDHGAMPDACYLLYSLGMARDRRSIPIWQRIADLLNPAEDDFKDKKAGIFYYVDSLCYGMERLGDPQCIPILKQLHRNKWMRQLHNNKGFEVDYYIERRSILELAIGRALARCGAVEGYEILINYLDDVRSLLSLQAYSELKRLSSRDFSKNRDNWMKWLRENQQHIHPQPYIEHWDMIPNEKILRKEIL